MNDITIQISDNLLARLELEAQRLRIPRDALIRSILIHYLEGEDPTEDALLTDIRRQLIERLDNEQDNLKR